MTVPLKSELFLKALVWGVLAWACLGRGALVFAESPTNGSASITSLAMGGNNVALPVDSLCLLQNPAGSPLTAGGTGFMAATHLLSDNRNDRLGLLSPIRVNSVGTHLQRDDFGLNFGYEFSHLEPQLGPDNSVGALGFKANREYQFGGAYYFKSLRTSVGLSWVGRQVVFTEPNQATQTVLVPMSHRAHAGVLVFLPRRWFLGFSARSDELNAGVSYWPNRFFQAQFAVRENSGKGFVPSLGVSYEPLSLRLFKLRTLAGTYRSTESQVHLTTGIEAIISLVKLSGGWDLAAGYAQKSFSIQIDFELLAKKLGFLPSGVPAPAGGILPNALEWSDDWMPTELQEDPDNAFQSIGPSFDEIKDSVLSPTHKMDKKIENGFENEKKNLKKDLDEF